MDKVVNALPAILSADHITWPIAYAIVAGASGYFCAQMAKLIKAFREWKNPE